MSVLDGLIPEVTIDLRGTLRQGSRAQPVTLADLNWAASDEMAPTAWKLGQGSAVQVHLWWRRPREQCVELTAGVTARGECTLAEWVFEVRVAARREQRFSWPFSAGAVVSVGELAEARRTLELTYPVYASMQWVDVFGAGTGVYAATHDSAPYFKHLRVHVDRDAQREELVFEFIYTDLEWPAGKQWTSPPLVLARHDGDWREGARLYRAWADTWLHREPIPEFMRRSCGHNMISFPNERGRFPFKQFPELAARTRRLGIDGVHIADWMQEGFDTFYPAFQADPRLGGEKDLQEAIRRMAAEGTWTCLYTNGRILDPVGPHGKHAFEWGVKLPPHVKERFVQMWKRTQDESRPGFNPLKVTPEKPAPFNVDGSVAQEWWGRVFAPMCPTVPGWQQLWLSRLSDLAAKLRPRMFQVDQVCGCWGLPCYDENHPHRSPSLAWAGYKEFGWAMRRRVKEVDPEIALWSEGVNDLLGQAFDALQATVTFDSLLAGLGEWDFRIFKYTFPEWLVVTGDIGREAFFSMAWSLVTGGFYHFFIIEPDQLDPRSREWVQFVARVRTRYWKEFAATDVFVPEVRGDQGVRVMGYRLGQQQMVVGAPLYPKDQPERRFEIDLAIAGAVGRVQQSEWLVAPDKAQVVIQDGRCAVKGQGPFVLLLQ